MLHDRSTVRQCLVAIFSVCSEDLYMEQMAKNTRIPVTLIKYISNPDNLSITPEEYALGRTLLVRLLFKTVSLKTPPIFTQVQKL